jgi:hypothetical protein
MRKTVSISLFIIVANLILFFICIKDGINHGDPALRFQEKETVTFLSAFILGLTSFFSLVIYNLKNRLTFKSRHRKFWLFSSLGFFYLMLDEYFMFHEGMDRIVYFFVNSQRALQLDGVVVGFFGLIALLVCLRFRSELLVHRSMIPFLITGGIFLLLGAVFDQLHHLDNARWIQAFEESLEFLSVSFFLAAYVKAYFSLLDKISLFESR